MITKTTGADNGIDYIRWEMTDGDQVIGFLDAHTSGLILSVEIAPEHRGNGFARELYEAASAEVELLHVPEWGRTEEGNLFAEGMGGETMDDDEAAEILGLVWDNVCDTYVAA